MIGDVSGDGGVMGSGDMDYELELTELERKFQEFARENPFHPAVIKAIARRILIRKDDEPCECVRDWLDLALKEPNNPRVLRVRKVVGHLKDWEAFVPEGARFEQYSAGESQLHDHVEPHQPQSPSSPESERPDPKLSEEELDNEYRLEYLRITKALKLFGEKNSGNSTIN
jgi:hypothetical protein